jgi:acyl-CoA thioester hydrolase
MNNTVIFTRKVNFYETDAQGIVHHSNYPRYFEEARGFFLEKYGFPYYRVREDLGVDIVLLKLDVEYKKPLFYGDICSIHITLSSMDRYFFTFEYKVYKDNELITAGFTKHCCIDRSSRRMVSIPDQIKNLFKNG